MLRPLHYSTRSLLKPIQRSLPILTLSRPYSTPASPQQEYENILLSNPLPNVSLITLNRPKALNALNSALFRDLNSALSSISKDDNIGAIVLTGSSKAFAAGADIKEMKDKEFAQAYREDFLASWSEVSKVRKPIVAAVSGYALGGGCELAMMCDIILCSPTAIFGQPEINLGTIPGAGGTQRLTRTIGKSRAMELVLTGKNFTGQEASEWGLVSRVVGEGDVVEEAVRVAGVIAGKGRVASLSAKEGVNAAFELNLAQGLQLERRLFYQLFATKDQKIGMNAFAEKKKAVWTNE